MATKGVREFMSEYGKECIKNVIQPIVAVNNIFNKAMDAEEELPVLDLCGTQPDLKYSRITDEGAQILMTVMSQFQFLRELNLSYNEIGDMAAKSIAKYIKSDCFLEVLKLKSNNIGPTGIIDICHALTYNPSINYLDISDNDVQLEGGMAIASMLQVNTAITSLFLGGCKLSATVLIALATVLQSNNTIVQLDISGNILWTSNLSQTLLEDVMTHLSAAIQANYGMRILDMSKMGITDYIAINMLGPALTRNRSLENLNLSANRIARDGGIAIASALMHNNSLECLKLSSCSIQDEGAHAMAELLKKNKVLKELYLDYNKINGPGLVSISKGLASNLMLKYISLWGNNWDKSSKQAFCELMGGPYSVINIGASGPQYPGNGSNHRLNANSIDIRFVRVEDELQVAQLSR